MCLTVTANNIRSSSVICQTTGPKLLPKRFLHIVRSRASSFNWQYPVLSLRSSSSFLRLLPRLHVTSICPFIFPSITCFRRQFICKVWPIQLDFRFLISCRISMQMKMVKHVEKNCLGREPSASSTRALCECLLVQNVRVFSLWGGWVSHPTRRHDHVEPPRCSREHRAPRLEGATAVAWKDDNLQIFVAWRFGRLFPVVA